MLGFLAVAACCVPIAVGAAGLLIAGRRTGSGEDAGGNRQEVATPNPSSRPATPAEGAGR